MSKQTGLGDNLLIDEFNLSGDIGSLSDIGGGPNLLEVTGIDKSGIERLGGQVDGRMSFDSFFNDAAASAHPVLSARPTADRQASYLRGTARGGVAACLISKQVNYDPSRAADGSLTQATQVLANGRGLEFGRQLTTGVETLTAGQTAGIDDGSATGNGLQAYLHVIAFTGTSATIAIQESSDDGSGDAYATLTGATFAAVTAVGVQRIATATNLSVEQWLRASISGTFSNLEACIIVVRNEAEPPA